MLTQATWRERLALRRMVWRVRRDLALHRLRLFVGDSMVRLGLWVMRWEGLDSNTRNDLGVEVMKLQRAVDEVRCRGTWTYLKDLA